MLKKMNKKGFTLAELLIVVAIIAVLVAISIPIFTAQLEKARDATTVANIRSTNAEASALMLSEPTSTTATSGNATKTAANVVQVANVALPCTDGNADVSTLPFTISLTGKVPATSATITFTFAADSTVTAAIN